MERRKFLITSSQVGISVAASSMLLGCSSGSSDSASSSGTSGTGVSSTGSVIDQNIVALDSRQAGISNTHAQIQGNINPSDPVYATTVPDFSGSVVAASYLGSQNLWENAKSAHQIAYDQFNHQYTKLKASLRLFDQQNNNSNQVSTPIQSTDLAANDPLNTVMGLLEKLRLGSLGTATLGLIVIALQLVYNKLRGYLQNDEVAGLDYAYSTYWVIETLLNIIKEKALSELSADSSSDILKSLAKVTVASVSVLGLASLSNLNIAKQDLSADQQATQDFLTSNSLDGSVSSVWMSISSTIILGAIAELKKNLNTANETGTIPDNDAFTNNLKSKSEILAITAETIKALFGKVTADAIASRTSSFTPGSTADMFKVLFTSAPNPYNEALSQVADQSTLQSAGAVDTSSDASTANAESDIFQFATQLASVAYDFGADTESDAVGFATHMANMAYSFTMKIENDAYTFAMTGMEYGYLFASKGEEVGVMADRILWMAVQIGVMADRIGEMGDRIVYTEQLIVYTEILILDFGILIYSFGTQISNTTLMGLALIFDREWYTPESNNIVLDSINSNVSVMLANMHQYSLSVLEHQNQLRESTQNSLETYAEPSN